MNLSDVLVGIFVGVFVIVFGGIWLLAITSKPRG